MKQTVKEIIYGILTGLAFAGWFYLLGVLTDGFSRPIFG